LELCHAFFGGCATFCWIRDLFQDLLAVVLVEIVETFEPLAQVVVACECLRDVEAFAAIVKANLLSGSEVVSQRSEAFNVVRSAVNSANTCRTSILLPSRIRRERRGSPNK
jgi:hypothetical protein